MTRQTKRKPRGTSRGNPIYDRDKSRVWVTVDGPEWQLHAGLDSEFGWKAELDEHVTLHLTRRQRDALIVALGGKPPCGNGPGCPICAAQRKRGAH